MWLVLLVLGVVALFFFLKNCKTPKVNSMSLVTGGVKSGKSTFSMWLVIRLYKKQLRRWRVSCFLAKIFHRQKPEKPLLYSNVPIAMPFVPLTRALLLRQERFTYGSVIYCQEASLVADSQAWKNSTMNEQLLLFNKLIGHETKGGYIVYDTQSINDNHYAVKRCVTEYYYVHHMVKWIPFFIIAYVRELRYSDDHQEFNVYTDDVEDSLKRVIFPKRVWKKFDCYCYSILTDSLPVNDVVCDGRALPDLKASNIVSFKKIKNGGMATDGNVLLGE